MKFIKKNIKLTIGLLIGMLLVSGISVYATYKYFATDVSYTKNGTEISVAEALNELYTIKKDYILPNGTKILTEKNNQIDVSGYQYADTTGLYTADEYQNYGTEKYNEGKYDGSGVGKYYDKKTINFPTNSKTCEIDLGYIPSLFVLKPEDVFSDHCFYSNDNCNTFYRVNETNMEIIKLNTFSISGNKIVWTVAGDAWLGAKLNIYAIK